MAEMKSYPPGFLAVDTNDPAHRTVARIVEKQLKFFASSPDHVTTGIFIAGTMTALCHIMQNNPDHVQLYAKALREYANLLESGAPVLIGGGETH